MKFNGETIRDKTECCTLQELISIAEMMNIDPRDINIYFEDYELGIKPVSYIQFSEKTSSIKLY